MKQIKYFILIYFERLTNRKHKLKKYKKNSFITDLISLEIVISQKYWSDDRIK